MKFIFTLLIPAIVFLGCSSKVVKNDQLKGIKKVAVIGFEMQQQRPVSGGDLFAIATHQNKASGATPTLGTESKYAEQAYKNFSSKLQTKTGWTIVKMEDVRKNPAYMSFLKSKTEGFQNRPMINDRFDLFRPSGIADNFSVMTTEKEKLLQLAKSLGVDAVITATTKVDLNANGVLAAVTGNGEYKPSGSTTIMIKDSLQAENILVASAEGAKVEKGEKNVVGMSNEDNLNILAVEATNLSVQNVLNDIPTVF